MTALEGFGKRFFLQGGIPIFAWILIESILYPNRLQYYRAIVDARSANDSGAFIEFTLSTVLNSIIDQEGHQVKHVEKHQDGYQDKHQVELTGTQRNILEVVITFITMKYISIFYYKIES